MYAGMYGCCMYVHVCRYVLLLYLCTFMQVCMVVLCMYMYAGVYGCCIYVHVCRYVWLLYVCLSMQMCMVGPACYYHSPCYAGAYNRNLKWSEIYSLMYILVFTGVITSLLAKMHWIYLHCDAAFWINPSKISLWYVSFFYSHFIRWKIWFNACSFIFILHYMIFLISVYYFSLNQIISFIFAICNILLTDTKKLPPCGELQPSAANSGAL